MKSSELIHRKGWGRGGWGPSSEKASRFERGLDTVRGRTLVISTHKPVPGQLGVDLINDFFLFP